MGFLFMVHKVLVKKIFLSLLSRLGLLNLWHWKNRHKICVLMLHGVMAPHSQTSWTPLRPQISPDELKRTLDILSRYYKFITIDQTIDILEGKAAPIDNALLITFDDGYRNNIDYALPIFEQFGIKPILFVATGHLDSRLPFWFDRIDYALQQNMGELISFEYQGNEYCFDATSLPALKASYQNFRDDCKYAFTDDIDMNQLFNALSEMLESRSGKALRDICVEDDWSGIVSWEQLKETVKFNRIDVGSHTVDHWRLDSLSEPQIIAQLQQSKMRIEDELATQCQYFCYPNGNYNELAVSLTKESGYRAAFATKGKLCKINDDLMTLKRFSFPENKTSAEIMYQLNCLE